MRDSIYRITLDIYNTASQVQIAARRGDSMRQVQATLTVHGSPYALPTGCRAVLRATLPDGKESLSDCEIRSDGTICCDFTEVMTAVTGLVECAIEVISPDGLDILTSPNFTVLVTESSFDADSTAASTKTREDIEALQAAVAELKEAQAEDDETEKDLADAVEAATELFAVEATYDFANGAIMDVDVPASEWTMPGGRKLFRLRLKDGARYLDLISVAGSSAVRNRWLLVGNRPTGQSSTGVEYVITTPTAQQPEYVYASMGIDASAPTGTTYMYKKEMDDGKWIWISDLHVTASLSGIAHDGQITPSADDVFAFLPLSAEAVAATAGQTPDYTNLANLPVHTVSYINTDWFTSGVGDLPTGWYYITTTGKKSAAYGIQTVFSAENAKSYSRKWIPDATTGGAYGVWKSFPAVDDDLTESGAAADAARVGTLFYGDADHTNRVPNVLRKYTGEISTVLDLPINCWMSFPQSLTNRLNILGCSDDDAVAAQRFPFPIRDYTYTLTRYHRLDTNVDQWIFESWDGKNRYVGHTSFAQSAYVMWVDVSAVNFEQVSNAGKLFRTDRVVEIYTEYTLSQNFWLASGAMSQTDADAGYKHTQLLPVRAGQNYYTANAAYQTPGYSCAGAWFDVEGKWLAPLQKEDISEMEPTFDPTQTIEDREVHSLDGQGQDRVWYTVPAARRTWYVPDQGGNTGNSYDYWDDQYYPASKYPRIYWFTAPAGAAYLSYNFYNIAPQAYDSTIASLPVRFAFRNGDLVIHKGDPMWEKKRKKTLCIIGPSTVMVNGLKQPYGMSKTNYRTATICGFQNYLAPYYKEVKCYGFSGAPMGRGNGASGRVSIYSRLFGGSEHFVFTKKVTAAEAEDYTVGAYVAHDGYGYILVDQKGEPYADGGTIYVNVRFDCGFGTDAGVEYEEIPAVSGILGYDEYLIMSDSNGAEAGLNYVGSYDSDDTTTYMGALRAMCEAIETANPRAVIYLEWADNFPNNPARTAIAQEIEKLANEKHYMLLERIPRGAELKRTNESSQFTYDGTHLNNEGQRLRGIAFRRQILGC